jgi:hypothetical protein
METQIPIPNSSFSQKVAPLISSATKIVAKTGRVNAVAAKARAARSKAAKAREPD